MSQSEVETDDEFVIKRPRYCLDSPGMLSSDEVGMPTLSLLVGCLLDSVAKERELELFGPSDDNEVELCNTNHSS